METQAGLEGYGTERISNTETTNSVSSGVIKEQNAEQIKYLLGIDDIEREFQIYLRRAVAYNQDTGQYITAAGAKPLLNEEGINEVMADLKFRTSRIFSLSDFGEHEIRLSAKHFSRNILKLYYAKNEAWNIDKIQIRKLVHDMGDMMYATLRKAKDGKLQKLVKDTSQYVETRRLDNGKGKFGVFS